MHPKYRETVDRLVTWSQQESTVHCALILGSQVRETFEGDEWSDLDVLLLVEKPQELIQTDTWLTQFGEIACVVVEETPLDWLSLIWSVKRVLFADHRTVDFSIMPAVRLDDVLSINAEIHAQGYRVIYETHPDRVASKIEATLADVKKEPPKTPTEDDVRRTINELLFHLMFACKKIERDELWVAVRCINQDVSNRLLQLIEFHTASITSTPQPIRYDGRFLEQRIPPGMIERLPQCFAKYDRLDAIRTVRHILDLTAWLSKAICERYEYSFNTSQFDTIRRLYGEMFGNESCH